MNQMTATCRNGHPAEAGHSFCSVCGDAVVTADTSHLTGPTCPNGHLVGADEDFCGMCGARLSGDAGSSKPTRRWRWVWVGLAAVVAAAGAAGVLLWPEGTPSPTTTVPVATDTTSPETTSSSSSTPANATPTLALMADQTAVNGDQVALQANGTDPDGDAIAFAATGLPSGLTMDATGLISGTISASGTYDVVVSVTDGTAQTTTEF
ncbi:MAG: Ig domain-containing protein, partial [Acidimicrobiia bacterium]|nr:Ig domain-containing protein [Acidimicrobiia bacterium]